MANQNEKTYVCLGSCQAVISEEKYNKGLTKCGTEGCTMQGKPFVLGKKSEKTGKNEEDTETEDL